jgi:transcriptional regulator with XRE-family HTH domain
MTTAKAIANLRAEMKFSQDQLAKRLGVTVTSISRYENGREPNRQALKQLATLAESAGLLDLRKLFADRWRTAVARRVERLPSARTQRRLALNDLKYWSAYLRQSASQIMEPHIFARITDSIAREHVRHAAWVMGHVDDEIEAYIDEPWSFARQEEDGHLLRFHKSKATNVPQGEKENVQRTK